MSVATSERRRQRVARRRTPLARVAGPLLTATACAAVLETVLTFVVAPIRGRFSGRFEDFDAYYQGARDLAAGVDPYSRFDPGTITMSGFDYPPFAAWLVRPLAGLSHDAAATLWLWIALAALVGGALVAARALLPEGWPRVRIALATALLFAPATYNLWHGQMNTVVFLLLALAARDWVEGREARCGVILGVAAGIKLSPAVLVVLLVRRGWWRGAGALVGTGAATVLLGLVTVGAGPTRTWFTGVLPTLGRDNGWLYNQTWNGILSRLFDHSVLASSGSWPLLRLATVVLGLATLGIAATAVRRGDRPRVERAAEFGAGVAAMLLVGTVAWYPHYTHLLLTLFAVAALLRLRGLGRERGLAATAAVCVVVVAVVAEVAIAALPMERITAIAAGPFWWPFLQLTSLPALSVAGLLVMLTRSLRRGDGTGPALRR